MNNDIIVMNFSHVYEDEESLHKKEYIWLDCTGIRGTDCYLDEQAECEIKKRISGYPPDGIHFIDSGNYHYISKLWTDKIRQPFSLILFDHHTDMQQGSLLPRMSCGSWVKDMLDENPYIRHVILLGVKQEQAEQIEQEYQGRVICYAESKRIEEEAWKAFVRERGPVYISIDKDVLRQSDAVTNWDQGSLSLLKLEELLRMIIRQREVIGIDICGEAAVNGTIMERQRNDKVNEQANKELLSLIAREEWGEYEEISNY